MNIFKLLWLIGFLFLGACTNKKDSVFFSAESIIVDESVDFGSIEMGLSLIKTISVANNDNIPKEIVLSLSGNNYSIVYNNCANVKKKSSCLIKILFSGSIAGENTGTLELAFNNDVKIINLTAMVNSSEELSDIEISPEILDYGTLEGKSNSIKNLTITNNGNKAITLENLSISDFFISYSSCRTLKPKQSCILKIGFDASDKTIGEYTSILNIFDKSVDLVANVASSNSVANLVYLDNNAEIVSFDFGTIESNVLKTFILRNDSSKTTDILTANQVEYPFSLIYNSCEGKRLGKNSTCIIKVLVPKNIPEGSYDEEININNFSLQLLATKTGGGVAPTPTPEPEPTPDPNQNLFLVSYNNNALLEDSTIMGIPETSVEEGTTVNITINPGSAVGITWLSPAECIGLQIYTCEFTVNSNVYVNFILEAEEPVFSPLTHFIQFSNNFSPGSPTCGLGNNHRLFCWGSLHGTNNYSPTGTINGASAYGRPTLIIDVFPPTDPDNRIRKVSSGSDRTYCFITWSYDIRCTAISNANPGVKIGLQASEYKFKNLFLGHRFLCAVSLGNKVYCLGDTNTYGQMGTGNYLGSEDFVEVFSAPPSVSIIDIQGAHNSVCILLSNGKVYCWGSVYHNSETDTTVHDTIPTDYSSSLSFKKLFVYGNNKCAISQNDNLYCWGTFQYHDLLANPTDYRAIPTRVDLSSYGYLEEDIVKVAGSHILLNDGTFFSLYNGIVSLENSYLDKQVIDFYKSTNATSNFCIVLDNNKTYCKGLNYTYDLGVGPDPENIGWPQNVISRYTTPIEDVFEFYYNTFPYYTQ